MYVLIWKDPFANLWCFLFLCCASFSTLLCPTNDHHLLFPNSDLSLLSSVKMLVSVSVPLPVSSLNPTSDYKWGQSRRSSHLFSSIRDYSTGLPVVQLLKFLLKRTTLAILNPSWTKARSLPRMTIEYSLSPSDFTHQRDYQSFVYFKPKSWSSKFLCCL